MTQRLAACAIFFGSFLLFVLQPMLSRALLPAFGGAASVWTCCLAAYQALLLAGYAYAHWLAGRPYRAARRLHLALLALAALWLLALAALRPALHGLLGRSAHPALEVLLAVLAAAGPPYVLLAANSALLQAWLAGSTRGGGSRGVYRLYALSNVGSLLGLLAYPAALEPAVPLTAQTYGFAACLALHLLLLAAFGRAAARASRVPTPGEEPAAAPPAAAAPLPALPAPLARPWLWFALPALSAGLLNAVTLHLSVNVLPVPMLWALLLAAFLCSYIAGFSDAGERRLPRWAAAAVAVLLASAALERAGGGWAFLPRLLAGLAAVFVCGTFLHAWLYRIRPETARLTRFYLGIAAGGAAGGLSASLLAPLLFATVLEYPLALALTAAACAWLLARWHAPARRLRPAPALGLAGLAATLLLLTLSVRAARRNTLFAGRNFYGCLRLVCASVRLPDGSDHPVLQMSHDATLHGLQSLDPARKREPTTYYGPRAGGHALLAHPKAVAGAPLRAALVGLGTGTLACYGRPGDLYRFFEINPLVIDLASDPAIFTYLSDSAARVECVAGDARKRLEEERARGEPPYDVLAVDAYTGDTVPLHLATREAFALYLDRLAPDGVLALHVSNWHVDLLPLCRAAARAFGLHATGVVAPGEGLLHTSHWVFLSRRPVAPPAGAGLVEWERVRAFALPTDEAGSLLPLLRLRRD